MKTYDGTDPSIFKTFLEDFQLGVDALDIPPKKQYLVLMNCLSGTASLTPKFGHVLDDFLSKSKP